MKTAVIAELKALVHRSRWCLEELVVDQKDQEANILISGQAKGMVEYLVGKFGSVRSVIQAAHDVRKSQGQRAKTLAMQPPVERKSRR